METASNTCGWYLPRPAKRVIVLAGLIIVVILPAAVASGHGETALTTLGVALLTATVTEVVKAIVRFQPRMA